MQKTAIYLDYMATTPVHEQVAQKMQNYLTQNGVFANPASTHLCGWKAQEAVELAKQQVADAVRAHIHEIIWTSGATEAINLAIQGVCRSHHYQRKGKHIVTCATEHKAVLNTCEALESEGFDVTYLKPQPNGLINLDTFTKALRQDTILVSIMHVNNEIGVIQPIQAMTAITRPRGILFHLDAAQSIGKVRVDVQTLNVDLMSLSAHKAYGPKGIGALFIRRTPRVHLHPILYGGKSEKGLRPGTLPVHQIIGMGAAFHFAQSIQAEDNSRLSQLHQHLWAGLQPIGGLHLNGDPTQRVPHNLNISFEGVDGESLLMAINPLCVSSGSACNATSLEPSHVLKAIGVPRALAQSTLRFSMGHYTSQSDIDMTIQIVTEKVKQLRQMSPLWPQ